jgi:hypothetical protein
MDVKSRNRAACPLYEEPIGTMALSEPTYVKECISGRKKETPRNKVLRR